VDEGAGLEVMATESLNITTRTHGRVLVREARQPSLTLIGFHGYMEGAAIQMERLSGIPGSERWTLVSVQGLHRFYRGRSEEVVASWMTRQDRELMIEDNVAYANDVLERVANAAVPVITVGFSQGAAMAFRAGVHARREIAGIVAVGGDVPPELLADPRILFPPLLIVRGEQDPWYTVDKADQDVAALRARSIEPEIMVHPGGHEWTPDVSVAVSTFVRSLARQ
jgi:predicted esterase